MRSIRRFTSRLMRWSFKSRSSLWSMRGPLETFNEVKSIQLRMRKDVHDLRSSVNNLLDQ